MAIVTSIRVSSESKISDRRKDMKRCLQLLFWINYDGQVFDDLSVRLMVAWHPGRQKQKIGLNLWSLNYTGLLLCFINAAKHRQSFRNRLRADNSHRRHNSNRAAVLKQLFCNKGRQFTPTMQRQQSNHI